MFTSVTYKSMNKLYFKYVRTICMDTASDSKQNQTSQYHTHTIYSNIELDVKRFISNNIKNSLGLHCYGIIYFAPSFLSWQEKMTYFPPKKYLRMLIKKSRSMGVVLVDR